MTTTEAAPRATRTAWTVWAVGVLAYVLAVMQRTSLGVAGLDAAERFAVGPGVLSAFVFVQIAVYVLAQVPAGLFVDRFGSRAMLAVSGALLGTGQLLLAFAPALGAAVVARVLVGAGDAVVFVAVLALLPRWFPARRVPLITQLTTILCQLGQLLSAVPFAALLAGFGWSAAFGLAASASLVVAVLALALVRDTPGGGGTRAPAVPLRAIGRDLRAVWARPGTRLGFFGHMGTQFPMMVFTLLWGVPYLVSAHGLTTAAAGSLLALFVATTIAVGPLVGLLTARHPLRRSWLLLGVIAAEVAVWTVVLARPAPAPFWLLVLLVVVLAVAGPGSVVGLDIGRTANPDRNLGVAQSIVNLGGFGASLLVLSAMGAVLTATGGFTAEGFRVAWLVQYPVWAVAVVGLLVSRRSARRLDAARGLAPRPLRELLASRPR
jgi:MFS family permease